MQKALMERVFMGFVDAILPPRCPVSGDMVDVQGMLSPVAWQRLNFIAAPFCGTCGIPFDFGMEDGGHCLSCIEDKPVFGRARAALRYDDASRELILGFKHGDKTHAVVSFLPLLRQAGRDVLEGVDYFIPVPLHPYRLLKRRYNQAAMISSVLSRDCHIPSLPLALKRIRSTPSQGHLKAAERFKNVKKAFALSSSYRDAIKGKKIVLIDDVFTTGATVSECAKVLLKDGKASSVDILTLARVVRDG